MVDKTDQKKKTGKSASRDNRVSMEVDIVDDRDNEWVEDQSKPGVEINDKLRRSHEQKITKVRVLEWLSEMTTDPKEINQTIHDVDRGSLKYLKSDRPDSSRVAQEGPLLIRAANLHLTPDGRSTGTSIDIFLRGVVVGLTHTEK